MSNLLRFIGIAFILIVSTLCLLAIGGVLSSTELWHNVVKLAELALVILVASALILLIAKKK